MSRVRDIRTESDLLEGAREMSERLNIEADAIAGIEMPDELPDAASTSEITAAVNGLRKNIAQLLAALGGE